MAWCTGWFVRLWMKSLRYRVHGWHEVQAALGGKGFVLVLWHDSLLLPLGHDVRKGMVALVSPDRDGEFLVQVLRRQGVGAVRGSSTRSGVRALLDSLAALQKGASLALTPDGPRGPRRTIQHGALWLATQAELPLVVVGAVAEKAWYARSWDRMCVPRPWTRVALSFSQPLRVSREELEADASGACARIADACASAESNARQVLGIETT
jgi:lysophospholipid acyltransferase (LPLAT)-like uncharacterized protein